MVEPAGVLAVWNNCAPGHEEEYSHWYITEHFPERLGVPGFRRGVRYEAVGGAERQYFTYYLVDSPAVLVSAPYVERLENPTPLTRKIMAATFTDASRTVCRVARSEGAIWSAYAIAMTSTDRFDPAFVDAVFERAGGMHQVTRRQLWIAEQAQTPDTEEMRARGGGDGKIASAIVIDCSSERVADGLRNWLSGENGEAGIGLYRFLGLLDDRS